MKRIALAGLALAAFAAACSDIDSTLAPDAKSDLRAGAAPEARTGSQVAKALNLGPASGLVTQDLTTGLTPEDLARAIVGAGVTISNVSYTGANVAAGTFAGGTGIIGFEGGIILSSGCVSNVVGPNQVPDVTCANDTPGDADLTELAGVSTYDAAVLEFDFVPTTDRIFIRYVFASDEYNEYVGDFNDVFGFFVNGVNYATVGEPAVPVAINTINEGRPGVEPTNPQLYVNNDPFNENYWGDVVAPGDLVNTEMDGLTVVLTFEAPVNPGQVNRMKLAIADALDEVLDSNVFIQAGTLAACPNPVPVNAVFSGEPFSAPGTINLGDPNVFVQFANVEAFIPRPAQPGDVRFGSAFEAGAPASNFTIADYTGDGNRDIRLVFSTQQLVNGGHLSPGTEEVTLWGRDASTGASYCAVAAVDVVEP